MRGNMRAISCTGGHTGPRDDCPGCPSTPRRAMPILPACSPSPPSPRPSSATSTRRSRASRTTPARPRAARGCSCCPSPRSAATCASRSRTSPRPTCPPALDPDGPEIARADRGSPATTVVCAGYTEAGPAGSYASAVCVSGDGVLGHHRKVHLPPAERFAYTPGDGFAAFDTPVGRLGMLLCYDKLFPEAARALALDGAEVDRARCRPGRSTATHPARDIRDDRQTRHFDAARPGARGREPGRRGSRPTRPGRWGPLRFLGRAKVVDPDGACSRAPAPTRASRSRASTLGGGRGLARWASTTSATAARTPTRATGAPSLGVASCPSG